MPPRTVALRLRAGGMRGDGPGGFSGYSMSPGPSPRRAWCCPRMQLLGLVCLSR